MHMNQPVWIVEDKALKDSEEGRKKLQEVADDHSKAKSSSRLTIVHGADFDKVTVQSVLWGSKVYLRANMFMLSTDHFCICFVFKQRRAQTGLTYLAGA